MKGAAFEVVLVLVSVLALQAPGLHADTLALTQPAPAACITDDGALYTVEGGELRPVRGQFMIFPTGGPVLHPRTAVLLDGEPGQLLHMYAWSMEHLDSVSVQIGTPGKIPLTKAAGFRVQNENGVELWAALLGIPAWGAEHEYTLTFRAEAGQRSYLLLQPFTVTERKFFSERIPLSADLTSHGYGVGRAEEGRVPRPRRSFLNTPSGCGFRDRRAYRAPSRRAGEHPGLVTVGNTTIRMEPGATLFTSVWTLLLQPERPCLPAAAGAWFLQTPGS